MKRIEGLPGLKLTGLFQHDKKNQSIIVGYSISCLYKNMQFYSWGVLLKNYFILGYHNLDQQNDAVSLLGCL